MHRVIEFHEVSGQPVDEDYTKERFKFRAALIKEECQELLQAVDAIENYEDLEDIKIALADVLKEMCDVKYVLTGTAVAFGWNFEKAYDRVCKNNMTKVENLTINPATGKVLKPKNYKKVDLTDLV